MELNVKMFFKTLFYGDWDYYRETEFKFYYPVDIDFFYHDGYHIIFRFGSRIIGCSL